MVEHYKVACPICGFKYSNLVQAQLPLARLFIASHVREKHADLAPKNPLEALQWESHSIEEVEQA